MGVIRKSTVASVLTAAATLGYLGRTTTIIHPLPFKDPVFSSPSTKKLLENDGDLVVEFCRGVWSGLGHDIQRRILAYKYRGPETARNLWTRHELATSTYESGTIITDHFEVVEKTPTTITVRCGDSPRNYGPRDSDDLFTFVVHVDRERNWVELGLKSVFFISSKEVEGDKGPMGPWMEDLHAWYSRLWMVTGSRRLLK